MMLGQTDIQFPGEEKKKRPLTHPTKINSKEIRELSVKAKTMNS